MLECLNIFGNATGGGGGFKGGDGGAGFRKKGDGVERERERSGKDDGKMTSLRMSYAGPGEPLVLL